VKPLTIFRQYSTITAVLGIIAGLLLLRFAGPIATPHHDLRRIVGSYHIHSNRSHDSRVTVEAYASAAHQLGLDFIVLTDHNVASLPPQVVDDVLVLFEQEQSTGLGHRVNLQGHHIIAHPTDSRRPWQGPIAADEGIEIATISSAARRTGGRYLLGLIPILMHYPINPQRATLPFYNRDDAALTMWDRAPAPQAALCGVDAHGWLPLPHNLNLWQMVLSDLTLPKPLTPADAPAVAQALSMGRAYCAAGLLGRAPAFAFHAVGADGRILAQAGGTAYGAQVEALEIDRASEQGTMVVFRDGHIIARTCAARYRIPKPVAGRYRVEVHYTAAPRLTAKQSWPLLYSNALTVSR
jgi:hypothetical protein